MRNLLLIGALLIPGVVLPAEEPKWPSDSAMGFGLAKLSETQEYEKSIDSIMQRIGDLLKEDCDWCKSDNDSY